MSLSEELTWRGFVNQTTIKDLTDLDTKQFTFYWGVDPSADSMHIGQLAMTLMIRHFINHGHKAILLVGGATGMIGDPDGRMDERDLKTVEEVQHNKDGINRQYKTLFAGMPFELVDNYDWFKNIGYLDFLRDIGKHFSMTQLLDRDFVQKRIGQGGDGISYAEFSYSLIQGYDFLHLYRKHGATLQIAGADQWGNSLSGVDLIRKLENAEAHVWTAPLIMNKATGKKFGKSQDGAVWLDEAKTSVFKFYQFWLNVDDAGVVEYLKLYTLLLVDEITAIELKIKENPQAREAQNVLAYEVTTLVHGEKRTQSVAKVTEVLFGSNDVAALDRHDLDELAREIPTSPRGKSLIDSMVATGLASSNGEAKRLIASNAVSVNGTKAIDDSILSQVSLIKKGKNSFALVR
ncbi:tyrosine--tRNA ligase [Pedobacter sp.]|nr:tyrosine--tRNA ligase [Candidatus Saccharibacteria bacterium]